MKFQEMLEDAGYCTRSYSGRGMYGAECLGVEIDRYKSESSMIAELLRNLPISCDNPTDGDVVADAYDEALHELADILEDTKTDSMGLGIIVYWPNVPFDKNLSSDSEDEDEDEDEDE